MAVGSEASSQGTGTVLLLDTPPNLLVGLDLAQWRVGKHFKGVTAIAPGCHFLHWVEAPVSNRICAEATKISQRDGEGPRESECTYTQMRVAEAIGGSQRGEFLFLPPHGVVVRRWAGEPLGRFLPLDEEEASRYSIGVREGAFMRGLGRYPTHLAAQWKSLTHCISNLCVKRVEPLGGCLEAEGMPLTAEEEKRIEEYYREDKIRETRGFERDSPSARPVPASKVATQVVPSNDAVSQDDKWSKREVGDFLEEEAKRTEENPDEEAALSPTERKSQRRERRRERAEAASSRMYYSDVNSVRGLAVRQSRLAASAARKSGKDADAAAAAAVTLHCADRSEQLMELLNEVEEGGAGLLGELQIAFIALVLGHHYPSLLHWKELLQVAAASERAVYIRPGKIQSSKDAALSSRTVQVLERQRYVVRELFIGSEFFARLLECLYFQLQQAPEDLLLDPESVLRQATSQNQNFLVHTCVSLLEVCLHVDREAARTAISEKLKEKMASQPSRQKVPSCASKETRPQEAFSDEVEKLLAKAETAYAEIERQARPLLQLMKQLYSKEGSEDDSDLLMLLQGEDAPVVVELSDNEML